MNGSMTFLEFLDLWLEVFKKNSIKPASYQRLQSTRIILEKYPIATMALKDISFMDVQRYINTLVEDGYSLSSIKKFVQIVSAPMKYAVAMQLIPSSPCMNVRLPSPVNIKSQPKQICAYTKEEQDKLRTCIDAHPENTAFQCVAFMLETGVRSGEALALRWTDVDLTRCRLNIHATVVEPMRSHHAYVQDSPKTRSSQRIIPLTPRAIAVLNLLKMRSSDWIFENKKERLSYKILVKQTRRLCKMARVEYRGEHVFRHTFATNCYYWGIDVKILSKLLGHASVNITYNTYINLYGDGFDSMYAALCF